MAKPGVFVVPNGNQFSVKHTGNPKPLSSHRTQGAAIKAGTATAKREKTELTILRPNGQIRDRDSYGNDPYPPKDKKH